MECSKCGAKTYVVDSRNVDGDVLRKRRCKACGNVMYTYEVEDDTAFTDTKLRMYHREHDKERRRGKT